MHIIPTTKSGNWRSQNTKNRAKVALWETEFWVVRYVHNQTTDGLSVGFIVSLCSIQYYVLLIMQIVEIFFLKSLSVSIGLPCPLSSFISTIIVHLLVERDARETARVPKTNFSGKWKIAVHRENGFNSFLSISSFELIYVPNLFHVVRKGQHIPMVKVHHSENNGNLRCKSVHRFTFVRVSFKRSVISLENKLTLDGEHIDLTLESITAQRIWKQVSSLQLWDCISFVELVLKLKLNPEKVPKGIEPNICISVVIKLRVWSTFLCFDIKQESVFLFPFSTKTFFYPNLALQFITCYCWIHLKSEIMYMLHIKFSINCYRIVH